MSDEASNVAVLKDAYRRWHDSKGGSVDHWMGVVADDIKFGSLAQAAPEMAFARSYSNSDALRGYFDGLLGEWEMIHYTASEFVAQGDTVFMRGSTDWRSKKTGKWWKRRKLISGASATARRSNITNISIPHACAPRRLRDWPRLRLRSGRASLTA
jgi:hypothetical protein